MSTDGPTQLEPPADGALSAVLAVYLDALDRGERPDRAALVARHPQLAGALEQFFADQDRLDRLAGPLRAEGKAEATSLAYELLEEIGRGGMGVVLRCRDGTLERDLAVKVLLDCYRDRPEFVRRFIEEARITGQLQHPFIVPVHELGTLADGRPYFAMKLVQGRTFAELLAARATPADDQPRWLHVFEQICQTIAYAHSKDVIHRDLKPANVMVGTFGEVQVMDWGLARAGVRDQGFGVRDQGFGAGAEGHGTQVGTLLGTPAYMAPEQARGEVEQISRRSDVFGLGAILCEVLTGMPPYAGTPTAVLEQARQGQLDVALARLDGCGADPALIDLAQRCLAAEAAERPADAAAVAEAMARHRATVQQRLRAAEIARAQAETVAVAERQRLGLVQAKAAAERQRRRAVALFAAAVLLLVTGGVGVAFWYQEDRTAREVELAERRTATERDVAAALTEARLRRAEGFEQSDDPARWQVPLAAANDALKRAENALRLGEPSDELRDEVAAARAQLDDDERARQFFATLERLATTGGFLNPSAYQAPSDPAGPLQAFRDYGLDLEAVPPDELAARVRAHPHRTRLTEEIDLVAHLQAASASKPPPRTTQASFRGVVVRTNDWTRAARLNAVLDAVADDPEAFDVRWRRARSQGDGAALLHMARSPEAQRRSPRAVSTMADDLNELHAFADMRRLLRAVLERHPTNLCLNQAVGMACVAGHLADGSSSLDEAVRYLTAATAARDHSAASHLLLSSVLHLQGKKDEALQAALAAVTADPASARAQQHLGTTYAELRDWERALACCQRATELDRASSVPWDALGKVYHAKKDYPAAAASFREALARARMAVSLHVSLGVALTDGNELDAAAVAYRKALELLPDFGVTHSNLGVVWMRQRRFDQAIESFRKAIACDSELVPAHYNLGQLLLNHRRDTDGAVQAFRRPVELHPTVAKAHFMLGDLLLTVRRHAEAEASLRRAIELDARYPEAHARLGNCLAGCGKLDAAIEAYRTALQQGDERAVVHDELGLALFNHGDYAAALASFRQALTLDPLRGSVAYHIGLVQIAQGEMEDAARSLRTALTHYPNNALGHLQLAKVLTHLGKLGEAAQHALAVAEDSPQHAEASGLLVQIHWETGDFAAGLALTRQSQAQPGPTQGVLRAQAEFFERCAKASAILPAVLRGDAQPSDAAEKALLAMICGIKERRYAAASRLLQEAFTELPSLTNGPGAPRFRAACFAVRAGSGEAETLLDAAAQTRWRGQALAWLRAELDACTDTLPGRSAPERGLTRFRVRRWQTEPVLAAVRTGRLRQLPADERKEWTKLWADVAAFIDPGKTPAGPDLARLAQLAELPARTPAEWLETVLYRQGHAFVALALARRRTADQPVVRQRYALARWHADGQRAAAADDELKDALTLDPRDPDCLVGRVVLRLREVPPAWSEAERFLAQTRSALPATAPPALAEDLDFLEALCHVAAGRPVLARTLLERLQAEQANGWRYREALEAMGP